MTAALNNHDNMHPAFPSLWVVGTVRLLAVAALSFACFLAWSAYQVGDIAGCSGGGVWDCSHVLHSKWAKWMTIPVSIPAAALYASMVVSLFFVGDGIPSNVRRMAWRIITTLAFAAALSAVWFVYLQVFVLEHLCKYCLVVHSCGLAIALLALIHRPFKWRATSWMAGLAAAGAAVLILGQVLGKAPQNFAIDVHEPVAADHSLADFDAPAEDDFSSPIEDVVADDVFAAPEEDVFEAPAIEAPAIDEQTRPVSTTAPSDALPEQSDSTSLPIEQPSVAGIGQAPLRFEPLKVIPKTRSYSGYVRGVPFDQPTPRNPLRDFSQGAYGSGSTNPFANSPGRVPTPTLTPPPEVAPAVPLQETSNEASRVRPASNVELVQVTAEKKKRLVRYPGADVNLNVANWPILGSNKAPHIVVELFDYTCPYCRTMHKHITEARNRFGDQIAFIVMPVPLSGQCNPTVTNTSAEHAEACEIARLALGVWRCNDKVFPQYHEWLMAEDRSRTAAEARQYAERLVDAAQLREVLAKPILSKFIDRHVALYKRAGEGTLPKLLTERVTVRGKMDSAEQLCAALAANLKLNQ